MLPGVSFAALGAVLSRDASLLSWRTFKGRRDRLHYSSNEICQRRLHSGAACTAAALTTTQHRRGELGLWGECESKEWNKKMGIDLAVLGWFYFLRCYMCACLSNWRWTKKALCCARAPLSAYQSSRQPQTLSVEGLELIGILMWTGGIEEVVVGEWWCKWGWRKRRNWCKIENRKRCYRLRVKRNPLKHEGNHCRKKMVRCGKSWKWGMNHSIQDGSDD